MGMWRDRVLVLLIDCWEVSVSLALELPIKIGVSVEQNLFDLALQNASQTSLGSLLSLVAPFCRILITLKTLP